MMNFLTPMQDWFFENLGKYFFEITFAILAIFIIGIAIALIIVASRNDSLSEKIESLKEIENEKNSLSDNLRYVTQDKEDLEIKVKAQAKIIREYQEENAIYSNRIAELEADNIALNQEKVLFEKKVEELKVYKEKSDAAKKAAETRKKKKEQEAPKQNEDAKIIKNNSNKKKK